MVHAPAEQTTPEAAKHPAAALLLLLLLLLLALLPSAPVGEGAAAKEGITKHAAHAATLKEGIVERVVAKHGLEHSLGLLHGRAVPPPHLRLAASAVLPVVVKVTAAATIVATTSPTGRGLLLRPVVLTPPLGVTQCFVRLGYDFEALVALRVVSRLVLCKKKRQQGVMLLGRMR